MQKSFNQEMNVAKAIGILAVVAGHLRWNIFGDLFPSYSFHMPLFFFIAGYFFKPEIFDSQNIKNFISYAKKIALKYLGRFYAYHFFYGVMTFVVFVLFNRLYGQLPTLKNLTLSPIDTAPFEFSAPDWFLYQLTISLIFFALVMLVLKKSKYCPPPRFLKPISIFLPLAIIAVLLSDENYRHVYGIRQILIKTFFSTFYIYAGYLYKNYLEKKIKFDLKTLGVVIAIQVIAMLVSSKGYNLGLIYGRLYHNISPFVMPFTGIYFVIFISKLVAPLVKPNSFIHKVGKNTLHIMANHLFVIFLIETVIFMIDGISFTELPNGLTNLYYKLNKYKFLYAFLSVIICTYIGEGLNLFGKYIKSKLCKK